ncbi:MAG: hypothetical protein GWP91_24025 [Rhodobacterales bacterium]|nr:hypothetical protein [Rhodobacterales bacterium]
MHTQRLHGARRERRGNYAIIIALMTTVLMAFGALAVDITYMRLVQAQAQNVVDAATQAALMELRGTGSVPQARRVAQLIAYKNNVGGQPATLAEIDFGVWNPDRQTFSRTNNGPNAVRAKVERRGADAVNFWLAPVIGFENFAVSAEAISASRPLHLVLSIDATGSWRQRDFDDARAAVLELAELLTNSHGPQDMVGMNVFSGPYAYEFTPLTLIADIANDPNQRVLDQWNELNVMSRAGIAQRGGSECRLHYNYYGYYYRNYFIWPDGGCYPTMPREYASEPGTDQSLGLEMSARMFAKEENPSAFGAQILLTDGYPNGYGTKDSQRKKMYYGRTKVKAHKEKRYESLVRGGRRSANNVRRRSVRLSEEMWEESRVHTYTVSFVADDWFLEDMPQGQGYYTVTNSSSALIPMFQAIGRSLPMALVQ